MKGGGDCLVVVFPRRDRTVYITSNRCSMRCWWAFKMFFLSLGIVVSISETLSSLSIFPILTDFFLFFDSWDSKQVRFNRRVLWSGHKIMCGIFSVIEVLKCFDSFFFYLRYPNYQHQLTFFTNYIKMTYGIILQPFRSQSYGFCHQSQQFRFVIARSFKTKMAVSVFRVFDFRGNNCIENKWKSWKTCLISSLDKCTL